VSRTIYHSHFSVLLPPTTAKRGCPPYDTSRSEFDVS
jgi:hypothetical protein